MQIACLGHGVMESRRRGIAGLDTQYIPCVDLFAPKSSGTAKVGAYLARHHARHHAARRDRDTS